MHTVAVFMGTRPEGIKMAPVIKVLQQSEWLRPLVVSTGQHREMLDQVIRIFDLPVDEDLKVMQPGQGLPGLTSRLMEAVTEFLEHVQPDFALVQGDTTTVLMASLACFYQRIPVGHVEAGLRTGDIYSPFPEEVNRRLAAPLMALHFAPTEQARENLLRENIDGTTIEVTGNTVIDALLLERRQQKERSVQEEIEALLTPSLPQDWHQVPYVLITGHRRESFGQGFEDICSALARLAETWPDIRFIYPVHLNPNVHDVVHARLAGHDNILLIPPVEYRAFVALMAGARLILTDSGGVQEEAPSLGKPVLVMRDNTERPEGVEAGTVKLVGTNPEVIVREVSHLLTDQAAYQAMATAKNPYGDGQAAQRIVARVQSYLDHG